MAANSQYNISIILSNREMAQLSHFISSGSAEALGDVSFSPGLFVDFLLDFGRFEWSDAAGAYTLITGLSDSDLINSYVCRATEVAEELNDLALIGGDCSF